MLVTVLIVLAALLIAAAALVAGLALAVRNPKLLALLMRVGLLRRLIARLTQLGLRQARKRAGANAAHGAAPVTDLELVLADQSGPEAEQAKAMLARMNPRQRREVSRMAMGADGLTGLMEAAAASPQATEAAMEMLGRSERRRAGAALNGASNGRSAAQTKAIAKRRRARKASKGR